MFSIFKFWRDKKISQININLGVTQTSRQILVGGNKKYINNRDSNCSYIYVGKYNYFKESFS